GIDQLTGITDLPARFGVERRAIEDQQALLARIELVELLAGADDAEHLAALTAQRLVTEEYGWLQLAGQIGRHLPLCLEATGRTGALTLFVHRLLEASHVHIETAFACDVGSEI